MQDQAVPTSRTFYRATSDIIVTPRFISLVLVIAAIGLTLVVKDKAKPQAQSKSNRSLQYGSPMEAQMLRELAVYIQPNFARVMKSRPAHSPQSGSPLLITEGVTTRAIALDSIRWTSDPFPVTQPIAFAADTRTRVMLFAENLSLSPGETVSAVTAEARDNQGRLFSLPVEYVAPLPLQQSISVVVVRLSDEMTNDTGEVTVRLSYHGLASNPATTRIGLTSPSPTPTPNRTPSPSATPTPTATPTPAPPPAAQTITVDPNASFQTMKGWESATQAGQSAFPSNFAVYSTSLFDQAVEMGLNRVRLEINGDFENPTPRPTHVAINDDADPFHYNAAGFNWGAFDLDVNSVVVPLRNRLMAQGESLYINMCYSDFLNNGGSFYHSDSPAEHAELFLAAFDRMQNNWGFVPNAVEVILEPDAGTNQGRWTAAKLAGNLLAIQSRLATAGYHPVFLVPSTSSCRTADTWYNNIKAANSNVIQYIGELSYHRYDGGCTATELRENRDAAQADGKRISMLEWWDDANSYVTLHADIGPDGNAVSWQPRVIAFPGQPGPLFLVDLSTNIVTMNGPTKFYRQYWKYIRFGAVRKGASTTNNNFDALAFRNVSGNYTVVVKCVTSGSFSIGGLPGGTYHITYTTASAYNQNLPDQTITTGQNITTAIPAAGVLTVYADAPISPATPQRSRIRRPM